MRAADTRRSKGSLAAACLLGLAAIAHAGPSHAASGVTGDGYFKWTTDIQGIDTSMGAVISPFQASSGCSTSGGGGCAASSDGKIDLYSGATAGYVNSSGSPHLYDTSGAVVSSGHLISSYNNNVMEIESTKLVTQLSGLVNYAAVGPTQKVSIYFGNGLSQVDSFDITSSLVAAGSTHAAFVNVYALTNVLFGTLGFFNSAAGLMSIGDVAYASPAMASAAALNDAAADVPEPVLPVAGLLLAVGVATLVARKRATFAPA